MKRCKVSAHQAFTLIATASNRTNTNLIDVTEHLVGSCSLNTNGHPRS
ncbi:ANTAR domain-containing protein [Arthrobacter sp. MDT1-48-3]